MHTTVKFEQIIDNSEEMVIMSPKSKSEVLRPS